MINRHTENKSNAPLPPKSEERKIDDEKLVFSLGEIIEITCEDSIVSFQELPKCFLL